jgi:signal transduction histidine kinase
MRFFDSPSDLLLGFWLPIAFIITILMTFIAYLQDRSRKAGAETAELTYRLEREKLEREYYKKSYSSETDRQGLQQASFDSALSDVATRITSLIERDQRESLFRLEMLEHSISSLRGLAGNIGPDMLETTVKAAVESALRPQTSITSSVRDILPTESDSILIREISHALYTPLSHIEILANTKLDIDPQSSAVSTSDFRDALVSLKSSVDICKSYLAAFREMILVSGQSSLWNPDSVRLALRAACSVYARSKPDIGFVIEIPDKIRGYSNNLIVAIILPLLENAIEASPPSGTVIVTGEESERAMLISVKNKAISPAGASEMLVRGFTTKAGHHGLGLSIVQNLISVVPGGIIIPKISGEDVDFSVYLPLEQPS